MNNLDDQLQEVFSEWIDGQTGQAADRIDVVVDEGNLTGTVTWSVTFNTDSFDPYYGDEDDTSVDVDEEEFDRQVVEQTTEHVEVWFFNKRTDDKKGLDQAVVSLFNKLGINGKMKKSEIFDPVIDYNYAEQTYQFEFKEKQIKSNVW